MRVQFSSVTSRRGNRSVRIVFGFSVLFVFSRDLWLTGELLLCV